MRLTRLTCLKDYLDARQERTGQHIITNASFDGSVGDSIRVNLQSPNSSYRRPRFCP